MLNSYALNNSLRVINADRRYNAGSIAWNDGQRGVNIKNGIPTLSVLGSNITDVCIVNQDGNPCQFVRPPNHDETLGVIDAEHILMVDSCGKNLNLQEVLNDINAKCKYRGFNAIDLNSSPNQKVVVRFQTAWVPIKKGTTSTKIVPQHYSYQTRTPANPRNVLLLGTPNGIFAHNDDIGGNKLFAHSVDEATGVVNNHWFEAEANKDCMVGHAVTMHSKDELSPNYKKAKAVEIGIRGMGNRTNCFVTVAIPNKQSVTARFDYSAAGGNDDDEDDGPMVYRSLSNTVVGKSFAARVSVAKDTVGTCQANAIDIVRPPDEPIVVTVLTYNTVEIPEDFVGDVTSIDIETADIALGVKDLDFQYELVKKNGGVVCKLSELPAMLHILTKEHKMEIAKKVMEDPPPKTNSMVPNKFALQNVMLM